MKRISLLAVALLLCLLTVRAQGTDLLDRMCEAVSHSCVEMEYSFSARVSGVMTQGKGILKAQGNAWSMDGNGVRMWCDGSSVWIADTAAKEVVIERASEEVQTEFMTNPAVYFLHIKDVFDVNVSRATDDGKAMLYSLLPKEPGQLEYLNVELLKDSSMIRRGSFAMKDGNLIKIEVSSMKLTPVVPVEAFRPQTVFDSTWIVTDMR